MGVKRERDANFEALRILSMLMIVIWHVCVHGLESYISISDMGLINKFNYHLIKSITIVAVNIYVLISGYFLCKTQIKLEKVLKLIFETFAFSIFIYLFLIFVGITDFSLSSFMQSFFPIFFGRYWFVSVYLVMFLLFPFLNIIVKNIDKKQHGILLILLFFVNNIWQFVYPLDNLGVVRGFGITHFIFLYFLASFIRVYGSVFKTQKRRFYLLGYLILVLVNTFLNLFLSIFITTGRLYSNNSPIVILMAYFLFIFFKMTSIKSVFVNNYSKYVFGVYLIHEHTILRDLIWGKLNIVEDIIDNELFIIPKLLVYGGFIFIICWIISRIITPFFNKIFNYIIKYIPWDLLKTKIVNLIEIVK